MNESMWAGISQQSQQNAQMAAMQNQYSQAGLSSSLGNIGSAASASQQYEYFASAGGNGSYHPEFARQNATRVEVRRPPSWSQVQSPKQEKTMDKDGVLPDINLGRVLKWAVVLLIALGLGKKVWGTFGASIEKQLHSALGATEDAK